MSDFCLVSHVFGYASAKPEFVAQILVNCYLLLFPIISEREGPLVAHLLDSSRQACDLPVIYNSKPDTNNSWEPFSFMYNYMYIHNVVQDGLVAAGLLPLKNEFLNLAATFAVTFRFNLYVPFSNANGTAAVAEKNRKVWRQYGKEARAVCDECGKEASKTSGLKKCGSCRVAWYCSTHCQRAAWRDHKAACFVAARRPEQI